MTLTLKRSSLVAQVADAIRSEILSNAWHEWIPSERELSDTLHISRNTCRGAMQILRREMLVEPVLGRGIRVNRVAVRRAHSAGHALHSIGIIIPDIMSRLRPQYSLMIDGLRHELFDLAVRVDLHSSPVYYQANPERALEKLVEKNRHDCWILFLAREPLQRWFMRRGISCIVSGSVYAGIKLPCIDLDQHATCRHAAGKLISLGHRNLVFLNRRSRAAGDLESEVGFTEGVRLTSAPNAVEARTLYHNDSRENIVHLIRQLFAGSSRPTALLVANSYGYLSAAGALAQLGLRIPEDVSLISRDNDSFLGYVEPEPARYVIDSAVLIRKFMFLLRPLLEGGSVRSEAVRVFPRFLIGGSCRPV